MLKLIVTELEALLIDQAIDIHIDTINSLDLPQNPQRQEILKIYKELQNSLAINSKKL